MEIKKILGIGLLMIMLSINWGISQSLYLNNTTGDGNVLYKIDNMPDRSASFILFDDGTCSKNDNGAHQYISSSGFMPIAYVSKAYDKVDPFRVQAPTGPTGPPGGTSTNVVPNMNITGRTNIATSWSPCNGIENYFILVFQGTSTSNPNGKLEFYYDSIQLDLNTISGPVISNSWAGTHTSTSITSPGRYNTKLSWQYSGLNNGDQRIIYIPMTSKVVTGTKINVGSKYFSNGETIPILDQKFVSAGSPHDPNVKTVFPTCLAQNTPMSQTLTYTIRFQNEGDSPARNVVLEDLIDQNFLDINTISILDSEYPYEYIVDETTGMLTIQFNDIHLPGLKQEGNFTYDETESYVIFEICTFEEPYYDICIKNKVDIIFDEEPAITTNIAKSCTNHDVEEPFYFICGNEDPIYGMALNNNNIAPSQLAEVNIYPNPFVDEINIDGVYEKNTEIILFNNFCQHIKTAISSGTGNDKIESSNLLNGIYFISYIANGEKQFKKVVKH